MEFTVVVLLSCVSLVNGLDYHRRCLLYNNKCVTFCPRRMHPYHTRCDRNTLSQRTCDNPTVYELGYTCGWSRCDCNGDFVLDETSGECVKWDDCQSKRRKSKKSKDRRSRKPHSSRRRLKIRDDDDDPLEKMALR